MLLFYNIFSFFLFFFTNEKCFVILFPNLIKFFVTHYDLSKKWYFFTWSISPIGPIEHTISYLLYTIIYYILYTFSVFYMSKYLVYF